MGLPLVILGNRHHLGVVAAKQTAAGITHPDPNSPASPQHAGANPVIVELFTSEGCSSCPPADALLADLDQHQPVPNADIIVLGEHVDYWDHLGWRDRFSSSELTDRQREYQSYFKLGDVYTPQFVINGDKQLDGSDSGAVRSAIEQAAAAKPVPLRFTGVRVHGNEFTFSVESAPPDARYINFYAALVDPEDTTEVQAGENNGRTLHDPGVVRWLGRVGSSMHMQILGSRAFMVQARQPVYAATRPGSPRTEVSIKDGMRLVVFAQIKHIGPVLGAAACTITAQNLDSNPTTSAPEVPDACAPPEPSAMVRPH
ncbi:MAG TPA: DUF1223 domain-containing protein [Acidobacteriaceae bacterium]|nr:DUF1223 domain-containing protein [Acidobacteriaceae bacterium]